MAYTDAQLYQRELEKIFYGTHWCYVGLEVEIPNIGDYKLSHVGERQVLMVRDRVALPHGLVFVTFSEDTEPLEDFLGPQIMPWLAAIAFFQ